MTYNTPELVVLGPAASLVQGVPPGIGDSTNPLTEHTPMGLAVGLDD